MTLSVIVISVFILRCVLGNNNNNNNNDSNYSYNYRNNNYNNNYNNSYTKSFNYKNSYNNNYNKGYNYNYDNTYNNNRYNNNRYSNNIHYKDSNSNRYNNRYNNNQIYKYNNNNNRNNHINNNCPCPHNPPVPKQNRTANVVSLAVPALYDRFGDYDPDHLMYALESNRASLLSYGNDSERYLNELNDLVRPLVLRCNVGDQLTVLFTNMIWDKKVGIHLVNADLESVKYDGSVEVGDNPTSPLAGYNEVVNYVWQCKKEGVYHFHDLGTFSGLDALGNRGLYGALVVEPEGSTWTDPETGQDITDGLSADIHPPKPCCFVKTPFVGFENAVPEKWNSYREHVITFSGFVAAKVTKPFPPDPCDENKNQTRGGGLFGINYRSAHIRNTERIIFSKIRDRNRGFHDRPSYGEEQHHSSWLNGGDPDTPVLLNYAGDPVKFHVINVGYVDSHVFHLHLHQWHTVQEGPLIDSCTMAPQATISFTLLYGAGSRLKSIGDAIFHCHLYTHFAVGMWGLFRVFDTLQDSSQKYPDGKTIKRLQVLPDREAPPVPTAERPGFPNFIAGTMGEKSPLVPWPVETFGAIPQGGDYRPATELEIGAMNAEPKPGAMFTLNLVPNDIPTLRRNIVAVKRNILFNQYGWHDPHGLIYQLEEEEYGNPDVPTLYQPLVHRTNRRSVVISRLTNKFPEYLNGTEYDKPFPECGERPTEMEVGLHVHLVKFDGLVSDGGSVGWNYMSGARRGKFLLYRWWVDGDVGQAFFHDHLFPVIRQRHGLYGMLTVHPEGNRWANPSDHSVTSITGLEAVVLSSSNASAYREVVQFVADSVVVFNSSGAALNPPFRPGPFGGQGVKVVNYRSEPIRERVLRYRREHNSSDPDPADLFSSRIFGDPSTTLFRSYPGDQILIRLVQGAHNQVHSFSAYGLRWYDSYHRED